MAKRDDSKAGAKQKSRGAIGKVAKGRVKAVTPSEHGAAPKVRSPRSNGGPSPSRPAPPKTASVQAHPDPLGATISRRAADRLRAGHLWVYASDVVTITLPKPEETLLPVADNRGLLLGTALYSPSSQIALRLVSREALDEPAWLKLLASRLRAAIARRKPLLDAANDACRLCFSEADELPGLIADKRLGCTRSESGGRALDVCCYQGGFALHLAQVCHQVTGVDVSRASLEVAEQNLQANRSQLTAEVDWIEADAFEILRDWSQAGERFDAIVLDPPAFAKTRRAVDGALRGYKELNLRALKMLRPGGLLITCSCSHHVAWADLEGAVAAAAADASRRVRLLERRGAAPDHPVVLNLPETEYLKCLVLQVE